MKKSDTFFDLPNHLFSTHLEYFLNLPCYVFWKNVKGCYLGYNDYGATNLGYKKNDILGKTDLDIFPKEIALDYRRNDDMIIKQKTQSLFLENGVIKNNQPVIFSSYKIPIYDQHNSVIGILGLSFIEPIKNSADIDSHIELAPVNQLKLNRKMKNIPTLSEREIACLNLLCQGLTIKHIAKQLQISSRTVETYFERVKYKLNCHNKAELIIAFLKSHGVAK